MGMARVGPGWCFTLATEPTRSAGILPRGAQPRWVQTCSGLRPFASTKHSCLAHLPTTVTETRRFAMRRSADVRAIGGIKRRAHAPPESSKFGLVRFITQRAGATHTRRCFALDLAS